MLGYEQSLTGSKVCTLNYKLKLRTLGVPAKDTLNFPDHRHVWSQRVFSVSHHVQKCSHLASPATLDREGGLLSSEKLGLENIVKVK